MTSTSTPHSDPIRAAVMGHGPAAGGSGCWWGPAAPPSPAGPGPSALGNGSGAASIVRPDARSHVLLAMPDSRIITSPRAHAHPKRVPFTFFRRPKDELDRPAHWKAAQFGRSARGRRAGRAGPRGCAVRMGTGTIRDERFPAVGLVALSSVPMLLLGALALGAVIGIFGVTAARFRRENLERAALRR